MVEKKIKNSFAQKCLCVFLQILNYFFKSVLEFLYKFTYANYG